MLFDGNRHLLELLALAFVGYALRGSLKPSVEVLCKTRREVRGLGVCGLLTLRELLRPLKARIRDPLHVAGTALFLGDALGFRLLLRVNTHPAFSEALDTPANLG